ncbi:MAG: sugar phosphate isomerase/epimerase family protein, partial [Promethearchaeota archaeon]
MKLAVNQATLMKTELEIFLKAISIAGFKGVELRRDETFVYLENHSIEELREKLKENNLYCVTFNAIELFSLCSEQEFQRILEYTEKLMILGNQINCNTIIAVPSFLEDQYISDSKIISKTVDRLKVLAKLADNYSFRLGFEPLGFPNCSVRKIDMALKIIKDDKLPEIG